MFAKRVTVVKVANPLRPTERTIERVRPQSLAQVIADWPVAQRDGVLVVNVNGERVPRDDARELVAGDHVALVMIPAWAQVGVYVIQALIALAISTVVSAIFRPKKPAALVDQAASSPVYSITGSQNAARLGEPIPVGYGEFVQVPDFGSQPYTYFDDANDQYLAQILVLGQGDYLIDEMMVGESTIANLPVGVVDYYKFGPADHLMQEGRIEDAHGIYENVVTSPEVGDQELLPETAGSDPPAIYWRCVSQDYGLVADNPPPGGYTEQDLAWLQSHPSEAIGSTYYWGDYASVGVDMVPVVTWNIVVATAYTGPPYPPGSVIPPSTPTTIEGPWIGWFDACKPGARGDLAMLDFVFAAGLYNTDSGTGELASASVTVTAEFQTITDQGVPYGSVVSQSWTFTAASTTAQRFTRSKTLAAGRYMVRCHRDTASTGLATTSDRCTWFGLKLRIVRKPTTWRVYGNTTLVAVRIRATNGIASAATSRIRFRVRRLLRPLADPTAELVPTVNPADAFADIVMADYGAARPPPVASEIDLPALTTLRDTWAAHSGFNAVFAQKSTVFEALAMALQVVAASPLPLGGLLSVTTDAVKPSRVAMFTEANTSGLVVAYEFDKVGASPGVRVEYREPQSFDAAFVLYPDDETDVDGVSLFGCTSETTANQYARLLWNRKRLQRKTITFDTELEGLLLLPGDRFAMQHAMPHWGQVGIVDEISAAAGPPDATTLLVHGDGSDGSTSIVDTSLYDEPVSVVGGAQIDTAQSVFGGSSMVFGAIGDYIETTDDDRYDLGAIDASTNHTWRLRARWTSIAAVPRVLFSRAQGVPVSAVDAVPSSVVFLAHYDSHDDADAPSGIAGTSTGAVAISGTTPAYGAGSAYWSGAAGNNARIAYTASLAGLFASTEETTIEFSIRIEGGASALRYVFQTDSVSSMQFHVAVDSANRLTYGLRGGGDVITTWTPALNTWYAVAIVVPKGNTINITKHRLYVNGALTHESAVTPGAGTASTPANWYIGNRTVFNNGWVGRIDEVRFTKRALYTTDYTASGPFPNPPTITGSGPGAPMGGYVIYEVGGKLAISVSHNAPAAAYWATWQTTAAVVAAGSWYALAFVIEAGVPRIFVDGTERAGEWVGGDGSQSSFIGLDTTRAGWPLRIAAPSDAPPIVALTWDAATTSIPGLMSADRLRVQYGDASGTAHPQFTRATKACLPTGKAYWEVICVSRGNLVHIGMTTNGGSGSNGAGVGGGYYTVAWSSNGQVTYNNASVASVATYTTGDRLMFAFDAALGSLWLGKNGTWLTAAPPGGTPQSSTHIPITDRNWYPACTPFSPGAGGVCKIDLCTSALYTVPTGFTYVSDDPVYTAPFIDADFASVALLLVFDAQSGARCQDYAATPSVCTGSSASQQTTQKKFNSLGALQCSSAGSYCGTTRAQNVGSGPFTWEAHIRCDTNSAGRIISSQSGSANAVIALKTNLGGTLSFLLRNAAGSPALLTLTTVATITTNNTTWYHVAVTRDGSGRIDIWLDGVSVANTTSSVSPAGAPAYNIGGHGGSEGFRGYIDNVRITEGVCRYTATFTPPSRPFPWYASAETPRPLSDATCKLLMRPAGYHGQQSFTDLSPLRAALTVTGEAMMTRNNAFFASQALSFDGTGDTISAPASASYDLGVIGTGTHFCFECFVWQNPFAKRILATHAYPTSTGNGCGGWWCYTENGRFAITVSKNVTGGTYWSTWQTEQDISVSSMWQHVAFVIENGIPKIYVDGALCAGSFVVTTGAQSTFIGLDTTRADFGLRLGGSYTDSANASITMSFSGQIDNPRLTIGEPVYTANFYPPQAPLALLTGDSAGSVSGGGAFPGWLDEISVIPEAAYTDDYTPETEAFEDPVIGPATSTLYLDRGLDWDAEDEPHAVLLSSEVNGVSESVLCERGAADHIVLLLEPDPFPLFGKGDHQEPTRIAFGTMGSEVRDWVCVTVTPQTQTQVRVEGVTYNPDVYIGALDHQGGGTLPGDVGTWIVAGTPADPSAPDEVIAGIPSSTFADEVLAGTPSDPSADI